MELPYDNANSVRVCVPAVLKRMSEADSSLPSRRLIEEWLIDISGGNVDQSTARRVLRSVEYAKARPFLGGLPLPVKAVLTRAVFDLCSDGSITRRQWDAMCDVLKELWGLNQSITSIACAWLATRYNEQEPPVPLHTIANSESDYESRVMLVTQQVYQDILPSDAESDGDLIAQVLLDPLSTTHEIRAYWREPVSSSGKILFDSMLRRILEAAPSQHE